MKNPLAWKYCPRCGKAISLDYYPIGKSIPEELDRIMEEHSILYSLGLGSALC